MKKLNQNLSEIFDVEPIEEKSIESLPVVIDDAVNQVDADAEFARSNMRTLITNGNDALEKLAYVADQSESPRAYEVLATMMKNLAEMNKDLLELQKRKRELAPQSESAKGVNIDKAVFVGSTTELLKMIKSNK
jgi:type II secretory pathway component PulF